MSWTDADVATPQQAWSDADVAEKKPKGFLTKTREAIESVVEPVVSMGANAIMFPLATTAAAAADIYSRSGTPTAPIHNEVFNKVQGMAYAPRSEGAKENLETIGKAFETSKLAGLPMADISTKGVIPAAVAATRQQAPAAKILVQSRGRTPSAVEAAQATYPGAARMTPEAKLDVANNAKMEAAEAAQRHGIAIDIPDIDPGGGRLRKLTEPDDMLKALSKNNKGKAEMALKQEVGIEPQRPLNLTAVDENLERLSGPKRQIEAMDGFFGDEVAANEIRALVPTRRLGMVDEHNAAIGQINKNLIDLTEGAGIGSGREVINSVEGLRKAARDIYAGTDLTPQRTDLARIYRGTADALERLLERRLAKDAPDLLGGYRQNRELMAKTYLLRDILDDNKETVNLKKLANQTAQDDGITGAFRDFGKIYANSPESFRVGPKEGKKFHASRYTVGGGAGAILGSPLGPVGAMIGAGAGTVISDLVAGAAARRLASPKHQKGYADALRRRAQQPRGPEPVVTPEGGPQFLPQLDQPVTPGAWREGAPQSPPLAPLIDEFGNPLPAAPAAAEMGGIETPMTGQFSPWTPGQVPGNMDAAASAAARSAALRGEMLDRVGSEAGAGGGMRQARQPSQFGEVPMGQDAGPAQPPYQAQKGWEQSGGPAPTLKAEKTQQFLSEMMDAMQRGDMEAVAVLGKQFDEFQAAMGSDAALEPLYARIRSMVQRAERPDMGRPPPPDQRQQSAFSQALRDFQGAP